MSAQETLSGVVKRLVVSKGFGFIRGDDDGIERFFHRSAVQAVGFADLHEGDRVTFLDEMSDKGPRCANVCRVE